MEYNNRDQEVSGVQFHEDDGGGGWKAIGFYRQKEAPLFVRFVLKHMPGFAKDEKQASKVLVYVSFFFFILSGVLFAYAQGMFTKVLQAPQNDQPGLSLCRENVSPELRATITNDEYYKIPSCK